MDNQTFFESSNGWQFKIDENGHPRYKFQDDTKWEYLGTQLVIGIVEWAQSPIWKDEV